MVREGFHTYTELDAVSLYKPMTTYLMRGNGIEYEEAFTVVTELIHKVAAHGMESLKVINRDKTTILLEKASKSKLGYWLFTLTIQEGE